MCAMARGVLALTSAVCILSLLETVCAQYTPTWAVHVPGGKEAADAVAGDHGFINLGEVSVPHPQDLNQLTVLSYHTHYNS